MLLRAVIFWSVASAGRLGDGFSAGRTLKDSSLTLIVTGESASLKMRADKNLSPDYEIGVFLLKL